MIEFKSGNLFDSTAQLWVNPVNCKGVMGAGIALAFKKRFPEMFLQYNVYCRAGGLHPGRIYSWANPKPGNPAWISNFPTKDDWRKPSKMEYIEQGLPSLVKFIQSEGILSAAMPALGCGLGGLDFDAVRDLMKYHFTGVDCEFSVYLPKG